MILDVITGNPMLAVIAAGEVGFWVLWLWRLTTVLVIWFVGWPLWASLAQPARSGGPW